LNADGLFAEFQRISDAPDAVTRLRRFVLDLAVRGRLSNQDPASGTGAELLERIRAVHPTERSLAGGLAKTVMSPFKIPHSWIWTSLVELAAFSAGRTPARNDLTLWNTGDHRWVSIADMVDGSILMSTKETVSEKASAQVFASPPLPPGTMLMSFKLTIGKVVRLGVSAYHNEAIINLRPYVPATDPYLFLVLPARARAGATKGAIKGATLNRESLSNITVPLPPLEEQHRIVAKVEELMALCDELEAAQAERERRRNELLAASVARLPEADRSGQGTRSALKLSSRLFTRPESMNAMRQAIIDIATAGRLNLSRPSDESVTDLITRLDRERTVERRGRRLTALQLELESVDRPTHWRVMSVDGLSASIDYGTSVRASREPIGIPILRMGNLVKEGLSFRDLKYLRREDLDERLLLQPGDLLFNRTNSAELVGKSAVFEGWDREVSFASYLIRVRPLSSADMLWVHLVLSSTAGKAYLAAARSQQTGQANINGSKLAAMPIPLPPVAEQRRIVAKVQELMAVCDGLERSLEATQLRRARLLEAVLHEALGDESKIPQRVLVRAG
jgi:type I restriction enzyme, S subunit